MTFAIGAALILLTIAMIMVARPKDGTAASFLRAWVVGQVYALAALTSAVVGTTLMLANSPF